MNETVEKYDDPVPNLIRRTGGGWLAVAPNKGFLSIGVTAATEEKARDKFRSVFNRWVELLATKPN